MDGGGWKNSQTDKADVSVLHKVTKRKTVYIPSGIWRKQWHPTPVLVPGKSYGQRSVVGYSPWGHKKLDMTERLHFHFSMGMVLTPVSCTMS